MDLAKISLLSRQSRFLKAATFFLVGLLAGVTRANPVPLEDAYQRVTIAAFTQLAQNGPRFQSLEILQRQASEALRRDENARAIMHIAAHEQLIRENISDGNVALLVRLLLDRHALAVAGNIRELSQQYGDNYSLAKIRLAFALHYAKAGEWQSVLNELAQVDIANVLDTDAGDQAFIALGTALQGQKRHREALGYYKRVKPESPHYPVAQLNTALAYIRQDWWTDARIAIEAALNAKRSPAPPMRDRLYSVLGFSQIQYGFYRDARESFRNVRTESPYANRALLGLGVAALNQEDMLGALNAFTHLKDGTPNDISVIESHLLSAYTLDRIGQPRTASAAYSGAIAYYQIYLSRCDEMIARLEVLDRSDADYGEVARQAVDMTSTQHRTRLIGLLTRAAIVADLLQSKLSSNVIKDLSGLQQRLAAQFHADTIAALTERKRVVASYLSQARFGLARLYDAP